MNMQLLPLSEEPYARESQTAAAGSVESAFRLWQQASEARLTLQAAAAQSVASAETLCRLGEICLLLNEPEAAQSAFHAAAEKDGTLPSAHIGLGRIAELQGRRAEAVAHLERARGLRPDLGTIVALLDKISGARPGAQASSTDRGSVDFGERFKFANQLMERRRYGDARAIYTDLLALRPTSPALLYKLGSALVELGEISEGAAFYDRAIAADPGFVWSYVGHADILEAEGRLADAVAALEKARSLRPDLAFLPRRLANLRRRLEAQATPDGPPLLVWPATVVSRSTMPGPRVAVVAWDLAHNAAGRAWILGEMAARSSDCEVVGPIFPTFGDDLWPPLRETERPFDIRGFRSPSFADFMNGAIRLVVERPCDVAVVSKPRFPSLLIGLLYKQIHGARLVLDIDDDELAFVDAREPLDVAAFIAGATAADWSTLHGRRWTQLAASLIGAADAVTVCNPVLQQRHGGTIVRHARDERRFASAATDREALRREFGFASDDKVVLFLGTPRRHKGVLQIADALRTLADPKVVLCVIGTIADERLRQDLLNMQPARVVLHPDQPFHRLAALNAMADVVCVLQDPDSQISLSQTPAKLTDALATGTPIIATALPPVIDLVEPGAIVALDPTAAPPALVGLLRGVLGEAATDGAAADRRRAFFRQELSVAVNAERVATVIGDVLARPPSAPPEELFTLLRHIDREMPGRLNQEWRRPDLLPDGFRVGPLRRLDRDLNIVLFWKQNDSGLYGRRPDMLVQELSRLPSVRRILQIDAPISVDRLAELAADAPGEALGQGKLVAAQVLKRFLQADDSGCVHRRTFVHRGDASQLLGQELPSEAMFPNAVQRWLTELDMTENVLAWVCPVVPAFAEIQARLGFSFVLSDVIDDQRQWPMPSLRRARIAKSYRDTFAVTDAAITNCETVERWLAEEKLPVRLVPNGMEIHRDIASWEPPPELARFERPIVGYSGSLTHRIDWSLIDAVAKARPAWTVVLIGAVPDTAAARAVLARPNVRALGVVPHDRAVRCIAAFDVAIVPHLRTSLSESMNPLKIYVYRSLGVPVVSTPVPNIGDFTGDIQVAMPEDFVAAIEGVLAERAARGRTFPSPELMRRCAWTARVQDILQHVQASLDSKGAGP